LQKLEACAGLGPESSAARRLSAAYPDMSRQGSQPQSRIDVGGRNLKKKSGEGELKGEISHENHCRSNLGKDGGEKRKGDLSKKLTDEKEEGKGQGFLIPYPATKGSPAYKAARRATASGEGVGSLLTIPGRRATKGRS